MITFDDSYHGRSRARQRRIRDDEIIEALNNFSYQAPARGKGRIKCVGRPRHDGSRVILIVSWPPKADRVTLVTCYIQGRSDGE